MKKQKLKTLCSAAWSDLNIDFGQQVIRHCCKMFPEKFPENLTKDFFNNSIQIQHARNELLNGVKTSVCNHCWQSYENTGTAYRDFKNTWKKTTDLNTNITNIEITLDNICDMSCTYCEGNCSSRIAQEQNWKHIMHVPKDNQLEVFVEWLSDLALKQKQHLSLNFQGGEVTYSKNFYKFIELLLKQKSLVNKNIWFSITTNCNSLKKNQEKIINLFNTLPKRWEISLAISNESYGEVAEKIRYGLDWERFQSNFIEYVNHERIKIITLAPTPNIFTIKYMHKYFEWVLTEISKSDKRISILGNWITNPNFLDVATCSNEYKTYIKENLKIIQKHQDLFHDYTKTTAWLKQLENRIGTMSRNENDLDIWIENISKQKNDDSLKNLRQFL